MSASPRTPGSRLAAGAALLAACVVAVPAARAAALPGRLAGAQDLGAVAAAAVMTATVQLPMADKAGFEAALAARYTPGNPLFRHWMTASELASFGPRAGDLAAVKAALSGYGLQVVRGSANGTSLFVTGPAAALGRAFGAQIHALRLGGRSIVANTATLRPQGALAGRVSGVGGLSGGSMHPFLVHPTDASGQVVPGIPVPAAGAAATSPLASFTNQCFGTGSATLSNATTTATYSGVTYAFNGLTCAYTPQQIAAHYGIDQAYGYGIDGTGQTIVVVDAYGSPTALADANTFFAATGTKPFTSDNFQIITPAGAPTTVNYGWAGEVALDIELAHAIAPGAKIVLAVAPNNQDTSLQAVVQYVIDNHVGNVVSNSYGEGESESDAADIGYWNLLGEEAAASGITLNFSTGDDGDYNVALGVKDVSSPSDSPWVTAVGGTSVAIPSAKGLVDTSWGNYRAQLGYGNAPLTSPVVQGFYAGGGGGESKFLAKPFWQQALPGTGRQQPDLSLIADPYTGAIVVSPTSATTPSVFEAIGGTSLSAPVFSALWAMVNQTAGFNPGNGSFRAGSSFGLPGPMLPYYSGLVLSDVTPLVATRQVAGTITTGGTTKAVDGFGLLGIPSDPAALTTLRLRSDGGYSVLSFNTDSSLATGIGYDSGTGYGTPNGPGAIATALAIIATYK